MRILGSNQSISPWCNCSCRFAFAQKKLLNEDKIALCLFYFPIKLNNLKMSYPFMVIYTIIMVNDNLGGIFWVNLKS